MKHSFFIIFCFKYSALYLAVTCDNHRIKSVKGVVEICKEISIYFNLSEGKSLNLKFDF